MTRQRYFTTHRLTRTSHGFHGSQRDAVRRAASDAAAPVRWRSWPLVDYAALVVVGAAGHLLWPALSFFGWVAAGFWRLRRLRLWPRRCGSFLLPVTFEVSSLGLRRFALGRVRLVSWQAIRAYQLRSTGVVLFQRPDPTEFDLLSSLFVPYPRDEDEMLVAVRSYLVTCGGAPVGTDSWTTGRVGRVRETHHSRHDVVGLVPRPTLPAHREASLGSSASRRPSPRKFSA